MTDTQPPPQPSPPPLPRAGTPHRRWRGSAALAAALIALGAVAWQWWDARNQLQDLRQELARRLADADAAGKEARAEAGQAREAARQADAKLGLLEGKVAEFQGQQLALEALYQDLSRTRDETALAEVEQYLLIASQQLQLAGNVKAALIALQNADARLAALNRPQLTPVRRAVARDIDRLRALPHVDVIGLSLRLDNLMAAVDSLPLAAEVRPEQSAAVPPPAQGDAWSRWWRETWEDMKQLVRIRHMERGEPPLLTPGQTWFLRENLRLRLLSARLALLARDQTSFREDLKAAQDWVARYFDVNARSVAAAQGTLRQISAAELSIEVPDIAASLEALRAVKLPPAKGGR